MTPINIESSIIKLGTEAVLRYRTISAATSDSELPEVFLGGFIASRLYDEIQRPIHIERPYMKMAAELGISTDGELKRRIELQRADMAVYQGGRPSHIVEFKIFDEGTGVDKIVDDLKKARELADRKPISIALGLMICETSSLPLESRIKRLESALNSPLACGERQSSADWHWCFACYSQNAVKPGLDVEKFLGEL